MKTAALILFVLLSGCATDAAYKDAVNGQIADVVSTGIALTAVESASEANPLGPALLIVKPALIGWADSMPEPQRSNALRGLAAAGWGPAVNNLCIAIGGTSPACITIGIAAGIWRWMNPRTEDAPSTP